MQIVFQRIKRKRNESVSSPGGKRLNGGINTVTRSFSSFFKATFRSLGADAIQGLKFDYSCECDDD